MHDVLPFPLSSPTSRPASALPTAATRATVEQLINDLQFLALARPMAVVVLARAVHQFAVDQRTVSTG